ncbi:unnamed protein product [Gongylonema pulchrum]|uniref:Ovule protein n=1 Tax=Gongylonema pulchrum TaxID=637853 RepID=A0A183E7G1_9BILA|nr:unnamed protein product [Gongylonema pulchrum]
MQRRIIRTLEYLSSIRISSTSVVTPSMQLAISPFDSLLRYLSPCGYFQNVTIYYIEYLMFMPKYYIRSALYMYWYTADLVRYTNWFNQPAGSILRANCSLYCI